MTELADDTVLQVDTSEDFVMVKVSHTDDSFQFDTVKVEEFVQGTPTISRKRLPYHLSESSEITIIDSIHSGTGRSSKNIYGQVLKPILDLLQIKYHYLETDSKTAIAEHAATLKPAKSKTIVFISGDTSISELVNNLPETESGSIKIFNIPSGTGNALCRSLRINDEITAIKHLFRDVPDNSYSPFNLYEVDLPKESFYVSNNEKITKPLKFIVVFSWCFHASLVADSDTPEMRKHGIQRFQIAAHENLNREQSYHGDISICTQSTTKYINGPFSYLLVTPVNRFEPTFVISPKGDVLDDNLYLVGFNTRPNDELIELMKKVYDNGDHINDDRMIYEKVSTNSTIKLKINETKDEQKRFCIDGTIIVVEGGDEISIRHTGNKQSGWKLFIII